MESLEPVNNECPVCLVIMAEPCTFPCNHSVCIQCVNHMMLSQHKCPMCRADLPKTYDAKIDLPL